MRDYGPSAAINIASITVGPQMLSDAEEGGCRKGSKGEVFLPSHFQPTGGMSWLPSMRQQVLAALESERPGLTSALWSLAFLSFSLAVFCSHYPCCLIPGMEVSMIGAQESFSYEGWLAGPELTSRTLFPLAPQRGESLPAQTQLEGSPLIHV